MKKQWDDQSAINDIRAGKQEGATYLFNKYGGRLLGFFQKSFSGLSNEDAEDILQNTFIRFINQVRKESPQNVSAYLFTIGKNECYRFFLKKFPPDTSPGENDENNIPSNVDIEREISFLDCLAKALKKFEKTEKNADKCLEILTLMVEGWSIKEIANKIGRAYGATREFLSQCRKKLKPYVQPCRDDTNKW